MNNWIRKMSVVAILIFGLSLTGCLDNGGTKSVAKKKEVVQPEQPKQPTQPNNPTIVTKQAVTAAYNPASNKKPVVTKFELPELADNKVNQGAKVLLTADGVDPEGNTVLIKYTATGGKITTEAGKTYWTAPTAGGIYQIKAVANDGALDSDPEVVDLVVSGKAGGIQVSSISKVIKSSSMKKAISSATVANPAKLIINTGDTLAISLTYTSNSNCSISPEFSVATNMGSIQLTTPDIVGPSYTQVFTYTAPSTAPSGNSVTITFNIVNNSDPTDYATASITLVINTPPTISLVKFQGTNPYSISPSAIKTIEVTTSEADTGDVVTYQYSILSGSGSLAESTNRTGTVDYTAGAVQGTEKVSILAIDTRGGSSQYIFDITNVSPMLLKLADDAAADYTAALTASYDITTTGTPQTSTPVNTDYNAETLPDTGVEAHLSNIPTGYTAATATYTWYNYLGLTTTGTAIMGTFSGATATPDWYAQYPGAHTLKVKTVAGTVQEESYDTVYVNEAPSITRVSYTDSDGNTQTLWDGSSISVPQLSPGQLINLAVTINDPDNDRVSPTTDANGYFSDTSAKFAVIVPNSAVNWPTLGDMSAQIQINSGSGYTNAGTAAGTIKQTITNEIKYEVKPQASSGAGQYKYLVIRAKDGFDNVADASNAASYTITNTPAVTVALPSADGISKAMDASNTGVDTGAELTTIQIGYHPEKTPKAGTYYMYKTSTANQWKIYDVTAGAYIKDANGTDITITDTDDADDVLSSDEALAAPYDWLLVNFTDAYNQQGTSGDKIYFKTTVAQVIAKVEVVDGPKITSIAANKYVTLGQTMDIQVYGDNNSAAATVSIIETSSSNGSLAEGTDSDGDLITKEKWTYTAPSTMPSSSTVNLTVKITDTATGKKTSRNITVTLNRNPVLGAVNATSSVDTSNGVWAKKGAHNISLSALVSDLDTTDTFGYIWNLPSTNSGALQFATASSAMWEPYNGATALTATGGPTLNGHYPIQLAVYDKDASGIAKTGIAAKTIDIGINEDPDVGINATSGADMDGLGIAQANAQAGAVSSYDTTEGAEWSAAANLSDNTTVANGAGTTTINFNTAVGQPPLVKIKVTPVGVNDEPDDKNSLNYSYYLTSVTKDGNYVTTENLEYFTTTDAQSSISTKGLRWTPSTDLRKNGGTYWLHYRVTDDKAGVAKGITDWTEKIVVTKDETIPAPAPALADVTLYNTNKAAGAAYQATTYLKAGSRLKFSIARDGTKVPYDISKVYVNIGALLTGVTNAAGTADDEMIELTLNTQGTATPFDDTFDGEWIAPVIAAVDTANAVAFGTAPFIGLDQFRIVDLVGNQSADTDIDSFGTDVAAFTAIASVEADYDPPVQGALTNTTVTNTINGSGLLAAAATGSNLNGDTGLQVQAALPQAGVAHIGSRVALSLALSDTSGDVGGDQTYKATIADFSLFNPKTSIGGTYTNDTAALNAALTVSGKANQISLDTAAAGTAVYAGGNNDGSDLVLGESSVVSTWGASPTYNVTFKTSDNALANTAVNTWPTTDTTIGNVDSDDINFISWAAVAGNRGIDLKRPTVRSVEIYSYSKTAAAGEAGYAPVGYRDPAGTDLAGFAMIDETVTGVVGAAGAARTTSAKDIIDDENTNTAEIMKIVFDEPLYVALDIAADDSDDLIGTTVNNYSIKVYQYRANGIDKDAISIGPVAYDNTDFLTVIGGADSIPLNALRHFAYTSTGTGTTDTSTVYVLLQSKQFTSTTIGVNAGGTTITGVGTSFLSEVSAGDVVSIYDQTTNRPYSYTVSSVDSDTVLTVVSETAHPGAIAANANNTGSKSVVHIAQGNHFEVMFADYSTDATLNGTAGADTDDMFKILCDQHANAINASLNNYIKGHNEISY